MKHPYKCSDWCEEAQGCVLVLKESVPHPVNSQPVVQTSEGTSPLQGDLSVPGFIK